MMARRHLIACVLAFAAAAPAACSNDEPGVVVNVDLAGFDIQMLKVVLSASDGGFKAQADTNVQGVGVTTEDFDGDGALDLVTEFLHPKGTISFRVATGNMTMVGVSAHAIAFDATKRIAGADSAAPVQLPPGARESIALTLVEKTGGVEGPMTHTTDILTASADVMVKTSMPAHYASVAVCDVDADGEPDLVLGTPQADHLNLTATGAVYVLLGKDGGLGKEIDPANGNTVMEFHFYGADPGDQLGAAVACADLNGDHLGDLIVAAPGAALGTGRVYAVFGNQLIRGQAITPGSTGADAPDVTWATTADTGFGSLLFAADLNGDDHAEILVASSASSKKVHLLKNVTTTTLSAINVDGADHITFSGIGATAIAAGNLRHIPGGVDVVLGDSSGMRPTVTMGGGAIYGFADVKLDTTAPYTTPTMIMYGGDNMQFGAALLALATTSAGQDLIVGAPGDQNGTGAFYLYKGDSNFFGATERSMDDHPVRKAGPVAGGRFGASLAGTPTGIPPSYSRWDLIVGAPGTPRAGDRQLVGAAYLFGGGDGWLFPLYEQVFGAAATDGLGTVVAGGDVNGDKLGDLVTIAPNAAAGGTNAGVAYVVYGRAQQ
jgi:hypothetical protein